MNEEALRRAIRDAFKECPQVVDNLKRGQVGGEGFLVVRTLKRLPEGEATDPGRVLELIDDELTRA